MNSCTQAAIPTSKRVARHSSAAGLPTKLTDFGRQRAKMKETKHGQIVGSLSVGKCLTLTGTGWIRSTCWRTTLGTSPARTATKSQGEGKSTPISVLSSSSKTTKKSNNHLTCHILVPGRPHLSNAVKVAEQLFAVGGRVIRIRLCVWISV